MELDFECKSIIGIGRTATIFDIGNGKVLKLFEPFCNVSWIENEFKFAKIAKAHEILTPEAYTIIERDGKAGIIYDRVNGIDLGLALGKNLFKIKSHAENAARLQWSVHQIEDKSAYDWRDDFTYRLNNVQQLCDVDKRKIRMYIQSLPEGYKLCHGDLHVENFLCDGEDLVIIDWMGAYYGHPACDIARVILLMSSPVITAEEGIFRTVLVKRILATYNKRFLDSYLRLSGMNYELIEAFRLPIAALRLTEEIPHEEEWLKSIIKKEIEDKCV